MKYLLFITGIQPNSFNGGLFTATHNRIKSYLKYSGFKIEIINIVFDNGFIIKQFIKLFKPFSFNQVPSVYKIDGVVYKNYVIKRNIFLHVLQILGFVDILIQIYSKNIQNIIKNIKSELVIIHGGLAGILASDICHKINKKYVVFFHGSDINKFPGISKQWFNLTFNMINNSSIVFFVSKSLKKNAIDQNLLYNSNSYISYNSVNSVFFRKPSLNEIYNFKKKYNLNPKTKIVCYIGHLNKIKGVDFIPDIFKIIKLKTNFDINFLIIGEGPLKHKIKRLFRRYDLNATYISGLSPCEMVIAYNSLDVLILPSRNEGFGLVLLEALSCCKPCVASRVGGIPEIVNVSDTIRHGINFENQFAEKVIYYLKHDNFKNNFIIKDWDFVVKKEIEYLNNILFKTSNYENSFVK